MLEHYRQAVFAHNIVTSTFLRLMTLQLPIIELLELICEINQLVAPGYVHRLGDLSGSESCQFPEIILGVHGESRTRDLQIYPAKLSYIVTCRNTRL